VRYPLRTEAGFRDVPGSRRELPARGDSGAVLALHAQPDGGARDDL
jgi:hypothetical protein